MRILFVVPNQNGDFYKAMHPHTGIAYMMSILEKGSHLTDVVDLRVENGIKALDNKIRIFDPDIIGVSFMSRGYRDSYNFVKFIKNKYDKKVIIGGPHPSLFPEESIIACNADYAVMGEGEYAILALANKVPLDKIKNLVWVNGEKITRNELEKIKNLDALPFPDYTKFPLQKYVDRKVALVTSRGCPFGCIYCSIKNVMGRNWRARTAENIIAEIELWKNKGYDFFHIVDDNFSLNRERVERFCNLLIEKKLDIKFDLRNGIRIDTVDEEILKLMKRAGCDFISFGIESLDQEVLDASKKNLKAEKIEKSVRASINAGIKTGASFIIGLPKDTPAKFQKMLEFIKNNELEETLIYNCVPYPKTEMLEWTKNEGRLLAKPEDYLNYASYWKNNVLFETLEFTKEERELAFKTAERIVWRKLLKKELGPKMSILAYYFWINPILKRIFIKPGIKLWTAVRRIRWKQRYSYNAMD